MWVIDNKICSTFFLEFFPDDISLHLVLVNKTKLSFSIFEFKTVFLRVMKRPQLEITK